MSRELDRGLRRGVLEYARTQGSWAIYEEPPHYLREFSPPQRIGSNPGCQAQGAIVPQERLAEVAALGVPTVIAVGTRESASETYRLLCADEEVGCMGAAALLGLGLRHFAYSGFAGLDFSDQRERGFQMRIEEAGHSLYVYSPAPPPPGQSWLAEQEHLAAWLRALPKPAGVMGCNDDWAAILAETCRLSDIQVPDEIAILGVDNDLEICNNASPPLSSIALGTERAGYEAAALLDLLMGGGRPRSNTVLLHPIEVVARRSTETLAVADPVVARALRFIRENANRDIRVADLPLASGVSIRALQDRFRQYLSRTPLEEIHRCRVERIAQLLVDTDMTVREIAAASGFDLDAHVSRFFSRQKGTTPLEYRRKYRIS
jgi:LacI family transcriptional regulator, galactose operon repressor